MKKSKIILYVLIVFIVIIIAFLGYRFVIFMSQPKDKGNVDIDKTTGTIVFNNYLYTLPVNTNYEISNDKQFQLYSNSEKWGATIDLIDKNVFDSGFFEDYDKMEELLKKSKYDISNRQTIGALGVSFEMSKDNQKGLFAYINAYDNYEYGIMLYAPDDSMSYYALDKIVVMLGDGEKVAE